MATPVTRLQAVKSDADILTDLQQFSSKVSAFSFVGNLPQAVYDDTPTDDEEARIANYFASHDHLQWTSV